MTFADSLETVWFQYPPPKSCSSEPDHGPAMCSLVEILPIPPDHSTGTSQPYPHLSMRPRSKRYVLL